MARDDRGLVLVVVIIYVLLLTVLGTVTLSIALSERKMERAHSDVVKAYYIAEAGLEKAIYHITEMDVIVPSYLVDKTWAMAQEDYGLLGPDAKGDFIVEVTDLNLIEEIFVDDDDGDTDMYRTIYEIMLKAMGMFEDAPAALEAVVWVETYGDTKKTNKAKVLRWRQVGGAWNER